ncbi:MAG: adenylosuccinate lyase, partial [Bacteroidota bacterium]
REEAYDTVQPLAMQAWAEQRSFRAIVDESERLTTLLSEEDIDDAFDPSYHLRHVGEIFERVGL